MWRSDLRTYSGIARKNGGCDGQRVFQFCTITVKCSLLAVNGSVIRSCLESYVLSRSMSLHTVSQNVGYNNKSANVS
jgi:hypothetical protein